MIAEETVRRLVPSRPPNDEFRYSGLPYVDLPKGPERWIGIWSQYLRQRLRDEAQSGYLIEALQRTGLIATGIFRVAAPPYVVSPEFPIVDGYQFGAVLLRGALFGDLKEPVIPLEGGASRVPLIETRANLNLHTTTKAEGHVAAVFTDPDGQRCGITAAHVVEKYLPGQLVPVFCSDCDGQAHLITKAPGLIDAAKIGFRCGGPQLWHDTHGLTRSAVEGETVELHLGNSGKVRSTVMSSLSSPSGILSAAQPRHFLTDEHGHPGDSGSLVAAQGDDNPDLIGIYLGDAICQQSNGVMAKYGYGLDLGQAAQLLGASALKGDFHG